MIFLILFGLFVHYLLAIIYTAFSLPEIEVHKYQLKCMNYQWFCTQPKDSIYKQRSSHIFFFFFFFCLYKIHWNFIQNLCNAMNLEPKTPTAPKVSIRFKCWYLIYERGQNVISDVPGQSECFRLLLLLLQLLISMYIVWHFIDVVPHFVNRKPLHPNTALWWAGACTDTCWKLSKAEQVPDFTTAGRDVEFGYFPLTYRWILYSATSSYDYTAWCFWKKKIKIRE